MPHLAAFRAAIIDLATSAPPARPDATCVVVPTRGAGRQLALRLQANRCAIVTRDELYDQLHARLSDPPRRLTSLERDVIVQAAARAAAAGVRDLAFTLRPGLTAEILRFYDELRRHGQQVSRFEELIIDALGGDRDADDIDAVDRGAHRLRQQTRFLALAFREYERRVHESGGCDEHALRARLIADPASDPVRRVIVTVPDWIADPNGLAVADFDLLARIPGLEALDIVVTDALLASGFHERLDRWLPGAEVEVAGGWELVAGHKPVLVTSPASNQPPATSRPQPAATSNQQPATSNLAFTVRDREEELVSIARQIKADRRAGGGVAPERIAVVFKRPLPYLYLAAEVFPAARLEYQTFDALPLAIEPAAAALDLILDAVNTNFSRATLVALLRSPHFAFRHEGVELRRESIAALDRLLSKSRYLGELARLEAIADGAHTQLPAGPALATAVAVARDLAPLTSPDRASVHVDRLLSFWRRHAMTAERAGAAIEQTLESLGAMHRTHHDPEWSGDDLAIAVRRAIEEQTFEGESAGAGIHLLDEQAARYGDFDHMFIVGLIESDWPEKPRRNIFYPPAILKALGWPSEKDRRAADDARFLDLLASPATRTALFTFSLEDDAIVSPSTQLDEVPRARLSTIARTPFENARVFVDEALSLDPPSLEPLDAEARAWAALRISRTAADAARYHGVVGERPVRAWSVSALETYLGCPFKFFAQHVLRLEEEPDDEEVMDPRQQGRFVHEVFERFFRAWQAAGNQTVTPANLDAARELFANIVESALEHLPDAEAGLERTRLLGSPAAAGLGEAVLRMEAERSKAVVDRLLEHDLRGEFTIATSAGERRVALKGKADRLDLLEDGTFRLIDYKLGSAPNRARALQLPVYSLCAEQHLQSLHGRSWTLGEAVYLAFKGPKRVVPLFSTPEDRAKVLADAQQRLADTIDAIERGEFPPTPDDVWRCETCTYAAVCRKDYVGDV